MKLRAAALTDIGKVRSENEDRLLCAPAIGLFGVADGIGGLPGGAEAAECTVSHLLQAVKAPTDRLDLAALTQAASRAVANLGESFNPGMGIGSTLTFGHFAAGHLRLAHVGDSRCYRWRDGRLDALTEDHTVENEAPRLRAQGEIVVLTDRNRGALTRCIGMPGVPLVDLHDCALAPGDRYLFSTDGITRLVTEPELGDFLAHPDTPEDILRALLDLALERGGYDNLTGVLVFVDEAP